MESLFDLSVRVLAGTPTLGVHTTSRSRRNPERSKRMVDIEGS